MPIYKGDTPIVEASGRKGADGIDGKDGINGENGATYTPSISEEGILSWTNDKDLPNPEPVNVKGQDGISYTLTKSEDGTKIILTGSDGSVQEIADSNTTYSEATQTESGLMSKEDKVKLDNMSGGGATLPVGIIMPTATSTTPSGWLLCDGSAVSRETYAVLFSAIGTTYGSGDGTSTFNLPDMRNRVAVGNFYDTFKTYEVYTSGTAKIKLTTAPELMLYGIGDSVSYNGETRTITAISGSQSSSYYTLTLSSAFGTDILANKDIILTSKTGKTGGEKLHKLTVNEIPSHSHTYTMVDGLSNKYANTTQGKYGYSYTTSSTTEATGGSQAHNNLQPYITMNYIIYAGV